MHNTLAASDSACSTKRTLSPGRIIGGPALAQIDGSNSSGRQNFIAAGQQCLRALSTRHARSVTLLVVNNDSSTHALETSLAGKR